MIYSFQQTGSMQAATGKPGPTPGLAFSAALRVTDAAAASGFDFRLRNWSGAPPRSSIGGLLGLSLEVRDDMPGMAGELAASLAEFQRESTPSRRTDAVFDFRGQGDSLRTGRLFFNDTESAVEFSVDGNRFHGSFGSDAPLGCFFARCSFSGEVSTLQVGSLAMPVAVPAPPAAGLFAIGALLLGLLRRPVRQAGQA